MKTCSIPGCESKLYATGLCNKHYIRKKKGQNLTGRSIYDLTPSEKFNMKFHVSDSGCWNWNNPKSDGRANTFLFNGKPQTAYRVSWQLNFGPIPSGLCVLHRCDNGLCVNPDHLFLGTYLDNRTDMLSKKRERVAKGEEKKSTKLTNAAVMDIKTSPLNGNKLAKKYGVHRRTIYDILDGKTWKHIVP